MLVSSGASAKKKVKAAVQPKPAVEEKALRAAEQTRNYLDQAIATRKAAPINKDDVLSRCLKLQEAGMPGMSASANRS